MSRKLHGGSDLRRRRLQDRLDRLGTRKVGRVTFPFLVEQQDETSAARSKVASSWTPRRHWHQQVQGTATRNDFDITAFGTVMHSQGNCMYELNARESRAAFPATQSRAVSSTLRRQWHPTRTARACNVHPHKTARHSRPPSSQFTRTLRRHRGHRRSCASPPKPAAPKRPVAAAAPSASAEAPFSTSEPPLPVLLRGSQPAVDAAGDLRAVPDGPRGGRRVRGARVPDADGFQATGWAQTVVSIAGSRRPYAFIREDSRDKTPGAIPQRLWVRLPKAETGTELNGDCYTRSYDAASAPTLSRRGGPRRGRSSTQSSSQPGPEHSARSGHAPRRYGFASMCSRIAPTSWTRLLARPTPSVAIDTSNKERLRAGATHRHDHGSNLRSRGAGATPRALYLDLATRRVR